MLYYDMDRQQYIALSEMRSANQNVSFPAAGPEAAVVASLGYVAVTEVPPPGISAAQRLVEGAPAVGEDGAWRQTWTVEDLSDEEVAAVLEAACRAKASAVQAEKSRVRDAGFDVGGTHFDSDPGARTAYLELENELSSDAAYTTDWKASDGVWVTMDAALYASVKTAGRIHVAACFAWQAAQDAEISAIQAAVGNGAMSLLDALAAVDAVPATYAGPA